MEPPDEVDGARGDMLYFFSTKPQRKVMEMRVPVKIVGLFALSLALFSGGCSDEKSKSSSASEEASSSFRPLATQDAKLVLGLNLDKEQAFKIVDAYLQLTLEAAPVDKEDVLKFKEKIDAYKKDIFADCDPKTRAFIEESGLHDALFSWVVVSLEELKIEEGKPRLDKLSIAMGGKFDLGKALTACRKKADGAFSFEEEKIEGEKAWYLVPQDKKVLREMKEAHVDLYVTSLDGRLTLLALSRDLLAKQIRLYRKGEGKGNALAGFSAAKGELLLCHLSDIGNLARKNTSRDDLNAIKEILPDGDEIVYGLRNLTIKTKVGTDGLLSDSIRLEAASEKEADQLRTLAKTGLMKAEAQLSEGPKEIPERVKKMFEDVKIGGKDGVIEIQASGLSAAGVAAGALFPAISGAMRSANLSAMAMRGRNLYVGIIMANTEREGSGQSPIWPRTVADEGGPEDDIASRAFKSATEYFKALFDIKNYGKSEWEPEVSVDPSVLSGSGVPKMTGSTLESRNIAWIIAANVTADMPDNIPVLISANFNPALLLRKWDGYTGGSRRLPIGPRSGAEKSMFDDQAIVIIRKGGSAQTIKARDLTYATLYNNMEFDLTDQKPPLVYLTPTGAVEPVGHQ